MSKEAFEKIKAGLEDAREWSRGDRSRGKANRIEVPEVDVRAVRSSLGLSQDSFATAFGVSVGTVRNWEQGRRRPEGPARVLLHVIEREPDAIKRVLAELH